MGAMPRYSYSGAALLVSVADLTATLADACFCFATRVCVVAGFAVLLATTALPL
jgi:hypothetical protein